MPLINGNKFSCEPCIRGHRATSCAHTDRVLVEIRKPGRPLESCGHKLATCSCGRLADVLGLKDLFADLDDSSLAQDPHIMIARQPPQSRPIKLKWKSKPNTKQRAKVIKRPRRGKGISAITPPPNHIIDAATASSSVTKASPVQKPTNQAASLPERPSQPTETAPSTLPQNTSFTCSISSLLHPSSPPTSTAKPPSPARPLTLTPHDRQYLINQRMEGYNGKEVQHSSGGLFAIYSSEVGDVSVRSRYYNSQPPGQELEDTYMRPQYPMAQDPVWRSVRN